MSSATTPGTRRATSAASTTRGLDADRLLHRHVRAQASAEAGRHDLQEAGAHEAAVARADAARPVRKYGKEAQASRASLSRS